MFYILGQVVGWLIQYKYLVIFPFAVFEGPIITIVAGFLSSTGHLNFWLSFLTVVLGDWVSDTLYYFIGRFGREKFILRFGKYFGLNEARVEKVEGHFQNHPWKIFTFGKVAHGTGSIILVAAGMSRIPYFKFLWYNIPTTLANSLLMILIGYYFGHAYTRIDSYLRVYSLIVIAVVVGLYLYFIRKFKNIPE